MRAGAPAGDGAIVVRLGASARPCPNSRREPARSASVGKRGEGTQCGSESSDRAPAADFRNGTAIAPIAAPFAPARLDFPRERNLRSRSAPTARTGYCSTPRPICASKSPPTPQLAPPIDAGCAGEPDQGRRADQRRRRSCRRPVDAARGAAVQPLRLAARARRARREQRSSTFWRPTSSRGSNCRSARPRQIDGAGVDLGLTVEAFAAPGKVALYLEDVGAPRLRHADRRHAGLAGYRAGDRRRVLLHPRLRARSTTGLAEPSEGRRAGVLRRHALA